MFPGWTSVVADKTQGNELAVASASSSNKTSTIGFFVFARKPVAHSFIEEPPNSAIFPIGGGSAIWEDSLQAAFEGNESNRLNSESVVYDALAEDAVAIRLQQGDVVVVGEYQGSPDNSNGNYDLIAVDVSGETEAAADVLAHKPIPQLAGFAGIEGKALPGLSKSNWPKLTVQPASEVTLVGASAGQTSTSNSLTNYYEADIYNWSRA